MAFQLFFLVLLQLLSLTLGGKVVSTSTQCGNEVLNATTGSITYKVNEALSPNERCVWVLRVKDATDYSFGLFNLGFPVPAPDHQLTLTGFRLGSYVNSTDNHTLVPSAPGLFSMHNYNVIVITFHTGAVTNITNLTGFSLLYEAYFEDDIQISSSSSKDIYVASGEMTYLKYPASTSSYLPYELSLFIFGHVGNVQHDWAQTDIAFVKDGLDSPGSGYGCYSSSYYDNLSFYKFNPKLTNAPWEYAGRICHEHTTEIFSSNDLILVIFRTNGSGQGAGFRFIYSTCYKN